jgi:hypothetical protein
LSSSTKKSTVRSRCCFFTYKLNKQEKCEWIWQYVNVSSWTAETDAYLRYKVYEARKSTENEGRVWELPDYKDQKDGWGEERVSTFSTSSRNSGSDADASHRLFRIKMLGLDNRAETLWKKFFSCVSDHKANKENTADIHSLWLTVNINVDSALATKTNTSASRQCLSIQESKLGDTSIPGESTNTTSSLSKGHLSGGQ